MIRLILILFLLIITISYLVSKSFVFFPSDMLNYFPSFTIDGWTKPYNSLLADPVTQFEPWRIFAKESFVSFRVPLWNNLNGAGVPFLAALQNASFYPLNMIYYFFHPSFSLLLIYLAKLALFVLFTYFYLKALNFTRGTAFIGTVVACSSYMILWLQWPQTNVFLLLPILLFAFEKFFLKKINSNFIIVNSLIYFIGITGGHPETLFNIFIIHLIYIYLRTKSVKPLLFLILSVLVSILLGAFLIFPFLEYLFNSFAYSMRLSDHISSLPIISFPFFVFPQLLGAPHYDLYRSLTGFSNYAEYNAGSVGPISAILIFLAFLKFRKTEIVRVSLILILISFILSYFLGYLTELIKIPILSANAHQRFIAFAGFFTSIPVALLVYKYGKVKIKIKKLYYLLLLPVLLLIFLFFLQSNDKLVQFLIYEIKYLLFLLITTALFFIIIFSKLKNKVTLVLVTLFVQVAIPVIAYNNFTHASSYYPNNEFIRALLEYKDRRILQVGNMNLPPDINMAYGLESAENYDALDIKSYKEEFDKAFPVKNHLGLVDEVTFDSLERFGIGIAVSDYDLNSTKFAIQKSKNLRIDLNKSLTVSFSGIEGRLKGFRIFTQNYNRQNTCFVEVFLIESLAGRQLEKKTLDCRKVSDNMYYTIPMNALLSKDITYEIILRPIKTWDGNFIALLGDNSQKPFLEAVIDNSGNFTKIFEENSVYIFLVNNVSKIKSTIPYQIIYEDASSVYIKTNSSRQGEIIIKRTFYPGWEGKVNGMKHEIKKTDPFIKINVPSGSNLVELHYRPMSFLLGGLVSFFTFFILFLIFIKKISATQRLSDYKKAISKRVRKKTFSWHIAFFSLSFGLSIVLYSVFIVLSPIKFKTPFTTAINWHTVNDYPKQQDIFYFLLGVTFVISFTLIQWFLWLYRKK